MWHKALGPDTIIWAHDMIYALLLVCTTGYLSTCKDIALSASVGKNVSAVLDVCLRALHAMHSATGAVGSLEMRSRLTAIT